MFRLFISVRKSDNQRSNQITAKFTCKFLLFSFHLKFIYDPTVRYFNIVRVRLKIFIVPITDNSDTIFLKSRSFLFITEKFPDSIFYCLREDFSSRHFRPACYDSSGYNSETDFNSRLSKE